VIPARRVLMRRRLNALLDERVASSVAVRGFCSEKLHLCIARSLLQRAHPAIPAGGAMTMDKNRTEGAKNQVKGTAKEIAGKVTGNTGKQIEGKAQKTAGKVQSAVGKANDDARKGR